MLWQAQVYLCWSLTVYKSCIQKQFRAALMILNAIVHHVNYFSYSASFIISEEISEIVNVFVVQYLCAILVGFI